MSNNQEFPLQNKQAAITINGVHTEILLTGYADKIFVVITQYGKIGSLVWVYGRRMENNTTNIHAAK